MTRAIKSPAYSEVQASIYSALNGAGLAVYDDPGENLAFPYLTIGDSNVLEDPTKTDNADEHIETVNVWSRARGFKECKDIAAAAVSSFSGYSFSAVTGYKIRFLGVESCTFLRDPDGLTRHGVIRLKFKAIQE